MAQVLTSIEGRRGEAESWLRRSLEDARRQDARSAELRIATSLAGLLVETGRHEEAEAMLRPILDTFTEGHELPDLRDAAELLGRVETVRSQAASARPRS
jgi:hypothetical protein